MVGGGGGILRICSYFYSFSGSNFLLTGAEGVKLLGVNTAAFAPSVDGWVTGSHHLHQSFFSFSSYDGLADGLF